ncbi:MAG: TIGR02186 family protein [Gemmobacter sp.]|jgi:uncharacterized protein (TIGR02186 family)|nr:TIGR02186 family protein [Gemmobacter sp.]
MTRLLLMLLLLLPGAAAAEEIVAGLSQSAVSITADFSGSEILIYGAVKRDTPVPEGSGPLRVIITVQGPDETLTVRRKDRRFGVWVNSAAVEIGHAPSFYAIATSAPLREILTQTEDMRHSITLPRAIRAVGISDDADNAPAFTEALQRLRTAGNRYRLEENTVSLTEETLFRTDIALPAELTDGSYFVRIFLIRDGHVIDTLKRAIWVRKAGLERFLFEAAQDQPLLYGLASLMIAAFAGWAASALFARLRW